MKKLLLLLFICTLPQLSFAGAAGEVLKDQAKGAATGAVTGALIKKGAEKLFPEFAKKIGTFFDQPAGILLLSGVSSVYSGVLYNAAAEQEAEAKSNIAKIDKVMAEFKDSYAFYCPNGRDNLSEPNCYCYTEAGRQNPDRSRSQTCVDLWAKDSAKISAVAGNYSGVASEVVDPVGCMNVNGQFDETCKCKKFLDSKGNNACQKTVSVTIPNGIASTMLNSTGLKDVMQLAANTANGNPMFNNFSNGALGLKAISTENLKNQVLQKMAGNGKELGLTEINEGNINKVMGAMLGEKEMADALSDTSRSHSALDMIGAQNQVDPKANEALKAAATKAGLDLVGSGRGLGNKKAEAKEGMNFNFSGDNNGASGSSTQNFPEEQKVYKINSDISKNTDSNIFEIISNRYIQSGLKRLFEN